MQQAQRNAGHEGNSLTVFLVEDDADIGEAVADVLRDGGFQVTCATDGAEGLRYLRANPLPSVVLVDLYMPIMDGWEFLRQFRQDPILRDIPVIVMTAAGEALHDLPPGTPVLQKPITVDRLMALVRQTTRDA